MGVVAINHIQLPYLKPQAQATRDFYARLLGLPDIAHPNSDRPRYVAGAQRIDLLPVDHLERAGEPVHLAFEVTDLPQLRHALLSAGLPLDETRPLAGHRRFYVADPSGNRLEFLEPEPGGAFTV